MTYSQKLKDPRWQKKRLKIMNRDGWQCRFCQSDEETLHVHHRRYDKGKEPWDYEDENFETLCAACHKRITDVGNGIKKHLTFEPSLFAFEMCLEMIEDGRAMELHNLLFSYKKTRESN